MGFVMRLFLILILLSFPIVTFSQFIDSLLYTPMYTPMGVVYIENKKESDEKYEKDRGIYRSRYSNEYTALPETHEPDIHTIDISPRNKFENVEIIILEYED